MPKRQAATSTLMQRVILEPVGVVDQPVEHGIGIGGVADQGMPLIHGELAGDDGGTAAVAILEDLQEIMAGGSIERLEPPIVKDQEIDAEEPARQALMAAIAARQSELRERGSPGRRQFVDRCRDLGAVGRRRLWAPEDVRWRSTHHFRGLRRSTAPYVASPHQRRVARASVNQAAA